MKQGSFKLEIVFMGVGSQGIKTIGEILAQAAVYDGFYGATYPVYTPAARGGESSAGVMLATDDQDYPQIENADFAFILARICRPPKKNEKHYYPGIPEVRENTHIVYLPGAINSEIFDHAHKTEIDLFEKKKDLNILILGAAFKLITAPRDRGNAPTLQLTEKSLLRALAEAFPEKNPAEIEKTLKEGMEFIR